MFEYVYIYTATILYCRVKLELPQGCDEADGENECYYAVVTKYGLHTRPKNCTCKSPGFNLKNLCSCKIHCQFPPPPHHDFLPITLP